MTGRAHPGVDAYLADLPDWQRSICEQLREMIWATDPEIEETIKRTVQPYFVLDGNVCALLATKDHVNLFLYDPTVSDPYGVINQGTATRPAGRSRSTRTTRSIGTRSSASSPRSWRTTGGVGGGGSVGGDAGCMARNDRGTGRQPSTRGDEPMTSPDDETATPATEEPGWTRGTRTSPTVLDPVCCQPQMKGRSASSESVGVFRAMPVPIAPSFQPDPSRNSFAMTSPVSRTPSVRVKRASSVPSSSTRRQ
jgi:hypothetical protein